MAAKKTQMDFRNLDAGGQIHVAVLATIRLLLVLTASFLLYFLIPVDGFNESNPAAAWIWLSGVVLAFLAILGLQVRIVVSGTCSTGPSGGGGGAKRRDIHTPVCLAPFVALDHRPVVLQRTHGQGRCPLFHLEHVHHGRIRRHYARDVLDQGTCLNPDDCWTWGPCHGCQACFLCCPEGAGSRGLNGILLLKHPSHAIAARDASVKTEHSGTARPPDVHLVPHSVYITCTRRFRAAGHGWCPRMRQSLRSRWQWPGKRLRTGRSVRACCSG